MSTIAAICAAPPGPNPGMASVDLALYFLLKRLGLVSETRFYLLLDEQELHAHRDEELRQRIAVQQELPFTYELIRGRLAEVVDSRAIVFWGDCLHSHDYLDNIGKYLLRVSAAETSHEASRLILEHLYLAEQPDETLSRCIVFGETVLFNRESDYHDPIYGAAFTRFMRGVHAVWMRDFYSAYRVASIRNSVEQIQLGVDGSLLLQADDIATLPRNQSHNRSAMAGVFFGRSAGKHRQFGRFARALCRRTGVEAEWIPWGDAGSFKDRSREVARGFPAMKIDRTPFVPLIGDLLTSISTYRFVVTDTYHVCLNAWRSGVPAICIADPTPWDAPWNVSSGFRFGWRDKREVFFATFDAMDFFVHAPELASRKLARERLDRLAGLLTDEDVKAGIVRRLQQQVEVSERGFVDALSKLTQQDLRSKGVRN